MNANVLKNRSLLTFILLLFGLSIPFWVIGTIVDVQIFPGLKVISNGSCHAGCGSLNSFLQRKRKRMALLHF